MRPFAGPCGLVAVLTAATLASADVDEAWLQRASLPPGTAPLLVLLVDTSAFMSAAIDAPRPYDPARDYAPGHPDTPCRNDRLYWRRGPGPAPGCDSRNWLTLGSIDPRRGWHCEASGEALATTGVFVAARAAQWESRAAGGFWRAPEPGDDAAVECREDRGRHGATPGAWFAADGATGPWAAGATREPRWDAPPLSDVHVFFTGNYLNYLATLERERTTRYEWLVNRIAAAARSVSGIELAVARLSHDGLGGDADGRGGMIAIAPTALPHGSAAVDAPLRSWAPEGPAPLAEATTEVLRWLAGEAVHFGADSHAAPGIAMPSVAAVRSVGDPSRYASPITHACRPVTFGIATAGMRSADDGAADALISLAGDRTACAGDCLAAAADWLAKTDLRPLTPGAQRIALRLLAPSDRHAALLAASERSGHRLMDVDDPLAIVTLLAQTLQHDAGVPAGARVSAAGLESAPFAVADTAVYYGLSTVQPTPPWPGNLRRYHLAPADGPLHAPGVIDRRNLPAFDANSGTLATGSWSIWADRPDGASTTLGGAAAELPAPDARRLFSDLSAAPLTDAANQIREDHPGLTREFFSLDAGDPRAPAQIIQWLQGRDAFDQDADGDTVESRPALGDPGTGAPAVLRYANDGPGTVFVASRDGLLHAFDADTGRERWAFMPRTLLARLSRHNPGLRTVSRSFGLDGTLALGWHDADLDGRLDPADGDRAWLIVGLGRGGTGYVALDVVRPGQPELMWSLSAADLPGFGQSWPRPVIGRMRDPSGSVRRIVVLAGGYDPVESGNGEPSASRGAGLVIVDLETGEPLWRAGGAGTDSNLISADLRRSAPAAPRILDTDGDGLVDRMYLLDVAGDLFRFDFPDGRLGPGASMAPLARLGADPGAHPRRFFVTPDVTPVRHDGIARLALAAGSGWLTRPRQLGDDDGLFVVFDLQHDQLSDLPLEAADLAEVTDPPHEAPPDARGWFLRFRGHGEGERAVGPAVTIDHRLRFATYQPLPPGPSSPCGPPAGVSRAYTLDVRNGRPVNWIGDEPVSAEEIAVDGLPPAATAAFPASAPGGCGAVRCAPPISMLVGGNAVPTGYRNERLRTSWRQLDAAAE